MVLSTYNTPPLQLFLTAEHPFKLLDMIKSIQGEKWKQLHFVGYQYLTRKYAVSSIGRAASYAQDLQDDGKILNGSITSGYRTLNLHLENSNGTIYLHREIAKKFCKKPSPKYKYVIHLNHKKNDNDFKNLRWATLEEVGIHQQESPEKIAYKSRQANKTVGLKLTIAQVRQIKETINNPRRKLTYKQLAIKYDVSEMTVYRIKSGENWRRVK